MTQLRQAVHLTRLLWEQERSDMRLALFYGALLPLALIYFGTRVHMGAPEGLLQYLSGALTMSVVMMAMSQAGVSTVTDRFSGRFVTLLYACRSRLAYFAARNVIVAMQGAMVAGGAVCALHVLNIVQLGTRAILLAAVIGGVGSLSVGAVGTLIGALARSAEGGEAALALAGMGLSFASPTFYRIPESWPWLRGLAGLSPLTHVAEAFGSVLHGVEPSPLVLLELVGSAALLLVVAIRTFERA